MLLKRLVTSIFFSVNTKRYQIKKESQSNSWGFLIFCASCTADDDT